MKYRISKQELGCIKQMWVALEGRPSVNIGSEFDNLTEEQLVQRAIVYWQSYDRAEAVAKQLRDKYNKQVFIGSLPTHDVDTTFEGYFAYVLKDRRSKGKYQILEAIALDR